MSAGKHRQDGQQAYVLHSIPYRETSLIVEVFSRDHGRVGLVARGARRPRAALRGVLMAFQPLELGWFGEGELRTLAKAEWQGGQPLLTGQALLVGYYLNELLMKLLPRDDAHPGLFDAYREALSQLARPQNDSSYLRRFELALLRELGYGLTLDHEADGATAIDPERRYAYHLEYGPVPEQEANQGQGGLLFSGRALLAMAEDDFSSAHTRQQAKQLMRLLLNHYLGGQSLNSRRIFMDLVDSGESKAERETSAPNAR